MAIEGLYQLGAWRAKKDIFDSLKDDSSRKGLIPCVAADLGLADALARLRGLREGLDDPASKEAVKEAICRLETSIEPAEPQDWMIWMLGVRHPTEISLGAESDNIYTQRAQAAADSETDVSLAGEELPLSIFAQMLLVFVGLHLSPLLLPIAGPLGDSFRLVNHRG